jgi:hypothetical protein
MKLIAAALAATATASLVLLPAPAGALPDLGAGPVTIARSADCASSPTVFRMRVGRHDGYDRVVFDFDGCLPPTARVRFVEQVRQDGSGDVVRLAGRAFVQVTFEGTESRGLTYRSRIKPGYPTLKEVAFVSSFEGYVNFGIGVAKGAGVRVFELDNPYRVVVDVGRQ